MIDIDPTKVTEWVGLGKTGIGLLRSALNLLPKSKDKDAIEHTLAEAERALAASNAKLAHELGYKLCKCTFPPQIMLWVERDKSDVCNNCGHTIARPGAAKVRPSWGHGYER
jgi:hypothetical protein